MKARIVSSVDHRFTSVEVDVKDLRSHMEARGYTFNGNHFSPSTRDQLQGQPQFKEWIGPMWDGDAIRYENQEAYNTLST